MAESRKTRGLNPPKHVNATHYHSSSILPWIMFAFQWQNWLLL